MEPNPHLLAIHRLPEDMAGRERFVRLDRNERVVPFAKSEFAAMIATLRPEIFSAYPNPSPLIERLARQLQVPAEWIHPTNGSDAAIRKLFQTYVRPGDTVVLAEPTYAMYSIYAQMFAGRVDAVSYSADRVLHVDDMLTRLKKHPRVLALACPDQPTGAVLPLEVLRHLAQAASDHDTLCVIDEAYFPFHSVTAVPLTAEFDNVAITRTFSKIGGLAGLRLGYVVAQPTVLRHLERVRGAHEVNAVAIQIGCYVVDHPEIGDAYMRDIEAGRQILAAAAAELGLGFPRCPANFQLLELPALDPKALVASLKDRGFLVKGGFSHRSVARCIRVTLAGPDVMELFAASLREICASAERV